MATGVPGVMVTPMNTPKLHTFIAPFERTIAWPVRSASAMSSSAPGIVCSTPRPSGTLAATSRVPDVEAPANKANEPDACTSGELQPFSSPLNSTVPLFVRRTATLRRSGRSHATQVVGPDWATAMLVPQFGDSIEGRFQLRPRSALVTSIGTSWHALPSQSAPMNATATFGPSTAISGRVAPPSGPWNMPAVCQVRPALVLRLYTSHWPRTLVMRVMEWNVPCPSVATLA